MEEENDFKKVVDFLNRQLGISSKVELTRNTNIEDDLRISGDDAEDLIVSFCKEFNVDASEFVFNKYFTEEGFMLSRSLLTKLIKGQKITVRTPLTLYDLEKAIRVKKLI